MAIDFESHLMTTSEKTYLSKTITKLCIQILPNSDCNSYLNFLLFLNSKYFDEQLQVNSVENSFI